MIQIMLADPSAAPGWILPISLLVLMIAFYAYNVYKQKKYSQSVSKLVSELKVGDKVKTYAGIYGTIVEIQNQNNKKTAILQTGTETFTGYFSIDIAAIYGIDQELEVVITDEVLPESNEVVEQISQTVEKPAVKPKSTSTKTTKK